MSEYGILSAARSPSRTPNTCCVASHTISSSPSQRATAPWVSRLLWSCVDVRDFVSDEPNLVAEDRLLAAERGLRRVESMQHATHARERERAARVDPPHA